MSQDEFANIHHEDALRPNRFELMKGLPKTTLLHDRMHRNPAFFGERHDSGTFETRQDFQKLWQLALGEVEEDVLSGTGGQHRIYPEKESLYAVIRRARGSYQHGLTFQEDTHFPKAIHEEGGAGSYDIHDGISQAQAGSDFHRTFQWENRSGKTSLRKVPLGQVRMAGRYP